MESAILHNIRCLYFSVVYKCRRYVIIGDYLYFGNAAIWKRVILAGRDT